jgi:aryl-alcohol dehydrogenase-like predicted oxidoreductase
MICTLATFGRAMAVSASSTRSTLTPYAAIAWVVQQQGVTTVIPGARNADQARANAAAGTLGRLPAEFMAGVHRIYDEHFRESVHPRW